MAHALALLAAASLVPPPRPAPGHLRAADTSVAARIAAVPRCALESVGTAVADDPSVEPVVEPREDEWDAWLLRERHARLQKIALSISVRRTVDEAELGLRLAEDFSSDPSILEDIDFAELGRRIERDLADVDGSIAAAVSSEELAKLAERQRESLARLSSLAPEVVEASSGSVARTVPKLRRVISKARELPLTVELPASINAGEGLDLSLALNETKNVAVALREVWGRLNGADLSREEQLVSLQRESKALLSLRAEATKLRAGIRLVQRQKELKSAYLVRFGESADLLGETLRADKSIMKLQKELGMRAALLEMERIYLTLESELSLTSALVDQLLQAVQRYGEMEASLRGMVALVQADRHEEIDDAQLDRLETDIAFLLLRLGLATADAKQESFSWSRSREALSVNLKKAGDGLAFYSRGTQLLAEDVQLLVNMIFRAAVQGYTLRAREVKLLRRIAKDVLTVVPFVIILIIPLSPLGHVLVFSFIQRFFPDFFPSQFTESRQNIMSMYSSITAEAGTASDAALFATSLPGSGSDRGDGSDLSDGCDADGASSSAAKVQAPRESAAKDAGDGAA